MAISPMVVRSGVGSWSAIKYIITHGLTPAGDPAPGGGGLTNHPKFVGAGMGAMTVQS